MTRFLLFALFFIMLAPDSLGLNAGLAPGLSVKNAFLYLIFIGIAADSALHRNRRVELVPVFAPYLLLFLYALFTWMVIVLFIDYPGYSAVGSLIALKGGLADHFFVLFVFFYGVLHRHTSARLIQLMTWLVIVGNVLTIVDDFNVPNLGVIEERYNGRSVGPIGEPNQYASFLVLFTPAAIALAIVKHGMWRIAAAAGAVASFLTLLLTASRGGMLGLLIGAVGGSLFLRNFVTGRAIVATGIAATIIAILAVAGLYAAGYGEVLYERTVMVSTASTAYEMSSGRTYLWGAALGKMLEQPVSLIFGYGWDAYKYFPEFNLAPHNTYLKIFFELGIFGLTFMLLTLVAVLRHVRNGIAESNGDDRVFLMAFVFGFLGILATIFFVDLTTAWILVWAYVGVATRLAVQKLPDSASHLTASLARSDEKRTLTTEGNAN